MQRCSTTTPVSFRTQFCESHELRFWLRVHANATLSTTPLGWLQSFCGTKMPKLENTYNARAHLYSKYVIGKLIAPLGQPFCIRFCSPAQLLCSKFHSINQKYHGKNAFEICCMFAIKHDKKEFIRYWRTFVKQ